MKKTPISRRLMRIANLLPMGCTMADIGTDHGYLPSFLIAEGISTSVIMSDINKGPLESAKSTFSTFHPSFQKKDSFRLGSGLEKILTGEVDVVVVAGMGGGLIRDILEKDIDKSKSFKTLILQPQTEQEQFRTFIVKEFKQHIVCEAFIEEAGKFYEILLVESEPTTRFDVFNVESFVTDFEFGTRILMSDLNEYKKFLCNKQNKYNYILDRLPANEAHNEKKAFCNSKLKSIEIILEALHDHKC